MDPHYSDTPLIPRVPPEVTSLVSWFFFSWVTWVMWTRYVSVGVVFFRVVLCRNIPSGLICVFLWSVGVFVYNIAQSMSAALTRGDSSRWQDTEPTSCPRMCMGECAPTDSKKSSWATPSRASVGGNGAALDSLSYFLIHTYKVDAVFPSRRLLGVLQFLWRWMTTPLKERPNDYVQPFSKFVEGFLQRKKPLRMPQYGKFLTFVDIHSQLNHIQKVKHEVRNSCHLEYFSSSFAFTSCRFRLPLPLHQKPHQTM